MKPGNSSFLFFVNPVLHPASPFLVHLPSELSQPDPPGSILSQAITLLMRVRGRIL